MNPFASSRPAVTSALMKGSGRSGAATGGLFRRRAGRYLDDSLHHPSATSILLIFAPSFNGGGASFRPAGGRQIPQRMRDRFDAIVIGSGFGGALSAHVLVHAGMRVLLIERGDWLERGPANWEPHGIIDLWPDYSTEDGYRVHGDGPPTAPALFCVGGLSVFYGGVSLRLREGDFTPPRSDPRAGEAPAQWPYGYAELEPYYAHAEALLGVSGEAGGQPAEPLHADPTEPWRSGPYPCRPAPLSGTSALIATAAGRLGMHPFRLPLAIHNDAVAGRGQCVACLTCDGFACAVGAKNDVASAILPDLIARGLRLEANTVALRLVERGGRVEHVECVNRHTGERSSFQADQFVLSAGTLGSAHLLMASELHVRNPAGRHVGRHLMRHCNGIVFGVFPTPPNPAGEFHKQVGIHDYYYGAGGHDAADEPAGEDRGAGRAARTGSIQQVHSPPLGLVRDRVPRILHGVVPALVERITGLLVIAEDDSLERNHVALDAHARDRYGLPRMVIHHRYTRADRRRRAVLLHTARRVLRTAGARAFYVHRIRTFSHAVGTVRMGDDPATAPLDHAGRFRGLTNLRVLDGSFMPSSGGVNPSLTISANALRAADLMVDRAWSAHHAATRAVELAGLPVVANREH